MGASEFTHYGFGRDFADAYRNAVADAQYHYGHDTYSGSLAAKAGDGANEYDTAGLKVDDFLWLVCDIQWGSRGDAYDTPSLAAMQTRPKARRKFADDDDRRRYEWDVRDWKRWMKVTPAQYRAVAAATAAYNSKWGPCGGVKVVGTEASKIRQMMGWKGRRGDVYLFFGMAPS